MLKLNAEEIEEVSLAYCKWELERFFWALLFVCKFKVDFMTVEKTRLALDLTCSILKYIFVYILYSLWTPNMHRMYFDIHLYPYL